jgi:hypothetical protein
MARRQRRAVQVTKRTLYGPARGAPKQVAGYASLPVMTQAALAQPLATFIEAFSPRMGMRTVASEASARDGRAARLACFGALAAVRGDGG